MTLAMRIRTAFALDLRNIARALVYRTALRAGIHPVQRLRNGTPTGPFYRQRQTAVLLRPRNDWRHETHVFGHQSVAIGAEPPEWLADVVNGTILSGTDRPWWRIPDFGSIDIKTVWELSRFDWVIALAQMAATGEQGALDRLNGWLQDWLRVNTPGRGPNWKCGQEASIRVMHLAAAALVLDQADTPEPGLVDLVRLHLQRISPTLSYAVSQDNNHGTSEAVALFVGGTWLKHVGDPMAGSFAERGRRTLEERMTRLVSIGGTFSQYSTTYHRMMLDSISLAELWRRRMNAPAFSKTFYDRAIAATRWLHAMTDPTNGDAPNTGANDGTHILRFSDEDYRDFRGTVQLATALFTTRRAFTDPIPGDATLDWLGISLPDQTVTQPTRIIDQDSGFAIIRQGKAMLLLRFPRFRFRPSQADVLHVDYWYDGINILRDSGTYGYNSREDTSSVLASVAGHNTIQFDDHDQMPRLGRFLYGDWIASADFTINDTVEGVRLNASYHDAWGCHHHREITLSNDGNLDINDRIDGFHNKAILRWHLPPNNLERQGDIVHTDRFTIKLSGADVARPELVEGWESRYYLSKQRTSILELTVNRPMAIGTIVTVNS